MKKTERDYEYLETSPEALAMGLRRITRPKRLDAILKKNRGAKNRVTIYLDADIVSKFKETAEKEKIGYQTLINNTLRQLIDTDNKETEKQSLKEELLKDKKFLSKLKTALTA
jgi:uncharacterized protein (DUF4415 family)